MVRESFPPDTYLILSCLAFWQSTGFEPYGNELVDLVRLVRVGVVLGEDLGDSLA